MESVETRNIGFEAFALSDLCDKIRRYVVRTKRVAWQISPMIKHHLWESMSFALFSEMSLESERLRNRQISVKDNERCSFNRGLLKDTTSTLRNDSVDCSFGRFRALDFNQEHGFLKSWLSRELSGIETSTGHWYKLSS